MKHETKLGTELVDGDRVWVQGHPVIVRAPRVVKAHDGVDIVRFEGEMLPLPENESLMNTGFNGGTYGQLAEMPYTIYQG